MESRVSRCGPPEGGTPCEGSEVARETKKACLSRYDREVRVEEGGVCRAATDRCRVQRCNEFTPSVRPLDADGVVAAR